MSMKIQIVALALSVAPCVLSDEVPWKFEGDTNRVAASTCLSAEACPEFCSHDVVIGRSGTPWQNLVRSIWTSSLSDAADVPVWVGSLLFLR